MAPDSQGLPQSVYAPSQKGLHFPRPPVFASVADERPHRKQRNKAAIHQNHGLFTVGRESVDEAARWFIALERVFAIQLKAEATGHPLKHVTPEAAEHTRPTSEPRSWHGCTSCRSTTQSPAPIRICSTDPRPDFPPAASTERNRK